MCEKGKTRVCEKKNKKNVMGTIWCVMGKISEKQWNDLTTTERRQEVGEEEEKEKDVVDDGQEKEQ